MSAGPSYSQATPLPPRRPADLTRETPKSTPPSASVNEHSTTQPTDHAQIPIPSLDECVSKLSALGVSVEAATSPINDNGTCNIVIPIRMKRITGRYGLGSAIQFPNQPLIDCRLAEPLARWIGEVVAPVFAANFTSPLRAIRTGPGYECRNRTHEATGRLSAHAIGLALDISGFELANGQIISFQSGNDPVSDSVLRTIRTAGCGWFTTVLGPGSDAAHANHLHLDIQHHGSDERYRICE
ncbi:MAG TPA: extensin family protein [Methylocystis sp.]